ncbi:hypothetical protein [Escherichia phage pEC-N1203-2Af.1]|nr:hypothetical protein [Escherichia phage pEC-N1203-2Af.1]
MKNFSTSRFPTNLANNLQSCYKVEALETKLSEK